MKIIGTIPGRWAEHNKYIMEVHRDEILNLMGFQYPPSKIDELLVVGNEIPISVMFNRLYTMANKEKELLEISAKLKVASDFINSALPAIKACNEDPA